MDFTPDEFADMQTDQAAHMFDTCTLVIYVAGATDEYGMPLTTWVAGPVVACGYDGRRHAETGIPGGTEQTQVIITDGRVRLPIDTEIMTQDRLLVTHRFGVLLETPILYELVGEPRRGPSGLLCDIRRVVNNG